MTPRGARAGGKPSSQAEGALRSVHFLFARVGAEPVCSQEVSLAGGPRLVTPLPSASGPQCGRPGEVPAPRKPSEGWVASRASP